MRVVITAGPLSGRTVDMSTGQALYALSRGFARREHEAAAPRPVRRRRREPAAAAPEGDNP